MRSWRDDGRAKPGLRHAARSSIENISKPIPRLMPPSPRGRPEEPRASSAASIANVIFRSRRIGPLHFTSAAIRVGSEAGSKSVTGPTPETP